MIEHKSPRGNAGLLHFQNMRNALAQAQKRIVSYASGATGNPGAFQEFR